MDHLDQLSSSIDAFQNLSKGVLRTTMASNDNGSLHFITSTGVGHNSREQEYIESSLLGTDLLSSQLPSNLLNDYINSVSSTTSNAMGNMQSNLIEQHYRPFNPDELHTLNNEPNNDNTVLMNSTKDIPGFNTLTSYDKMIDVAQSTSSINNGLAQITGNIESYVHFPLPGQLQTSEPTNDGFDIVGSNLITTNSQHLHHHHHLHHPQQHNQHQQQVLQCHYGGQSHPLHSHHLPAQEHIVNHQSVSGLPNSSHQTASASQIQHSLPLEQTQASSSMNTLSLVDSTTKVFGNTSSSMLIPTTALKSTIQTIPTMTFPLRRPTESPKRYISCSTLPSLVAHNQRTNIATVDNVGSAKQDTAAIMVGPSESHGRTDEETIACCVGSMESTTHNASCAMLGNINLPHKKRLSKKLGDPKENACAGTNEIEQTVILSTEQLLHRETVIANEPTMNHATHGCVNQPNSSSTESVDALQQPPTSMSSTFSCQLCGETVHEQLLFFNHLKEHYEPAAPRKGAAASLASNGKLPTGENRSSQVDSVAVLTSTKESLDGRKPKPKLPRVKHTKKLKNERNLKHVEAVDTNKERKGNMDDGQEATVHINEAAKMDGPLEMNPTSREVLTHSMDAVENSGEFSETEDMLEGIRTVVQKVQETVDTDANEELGGTDERRWFRCGHENGNGSAESSTTMQPTEKTATAYDGEELGTHEIHIQSGDDNYVLYLTKSQFNDGDILQAVNNSALQKPSAGVSLGHATFPQQIDENTTVNHYAPLLQSSQETLLTQQPQDHTAGPSLNEVAILSNSSAAFPLHSNVIRTTNGTSSMCNNMTLTVPSAGAFVSTQCTPLPDLSKARILKDEHKSDGEDVGDDGACSEYDEVEFIKDSDCAVELVHERITLPEGITNKKQDEHLGSKAGNSGKTSADHDRIGEIPLSGKGQENKTGDDELETSSSKLLLESVTEDDKNEDLLKTKSKAQKFLCPVKDCGRKLNSKAAFAYHQLQHTGERPHKCTTCEKRFFTCSALKVHERLHSGKKPYKCDICGHHFRQWGDLKYHKTSIHSDEKSHKCEFCDKRFARRYSLVLHRRIHTNEKNYVCDYCNKAFRASTYLQSHRKIHTGEKPHQCTICDKKFRCHGDMKRHLKIHSRPDSKQKTGLATSAVGKKTKKEADLAQPSSPTGTVIKAGAIDLTKLKPKRKRSIRADSTVE